jgi:hypothetical protein
MDSDIGEQLSRYKGLGVHLVTVSPRELLIHGGRHFLEQAARAGG